MRRRKAAGNWPRRGSPPPSWSGGDPLVLCAGNINFDVTLPVDRLPGSHEKITCGQALLGFGGSAANTSWWLGLLGCPTALAGAVGRDPMGESHLAELAAAGVDVSRVERVKTASGLAVILARGEEKRIIRAPGANLQARSSARAFTRVSLIYLSGVNAGFLLSCAREARGRGLPVFYGPAGRLEGEILDAADGTILNRDELLSQTGIEDPARALAALGVRVAAVTLPAGGCLVAEGGRIAEVPAGRVDPVDRTGGGDAFAAGFLAGRLAGRPLEECARMGNLLAREVILRPGARPAGMDAPFVRRIMS